MQVQDATVLITGANRGLGYALVEEALVRGALRIYATARDPKSLAALVARGEGRVVAVPLDVTHEASIREAAKLATDVEVLVNNAGLLASYGVLTSSLEDIQRDLDTNFFGPIAVTRAFLPGLEAVAKRGKSAAVVNVLSVASLASVTPIAMYSASKAAAFSATQALRVELAPKGIRVHGVLAGSIDTDMVKHMEMPKTSAADVARGIFSGLAEDADDIAPDPMSEALVSVWRSDPKAIERQLGSM